MRTIEVFNGIMGLVMLVFTLENFWFGHVGLMLTDAFLGTVNFVMWRHVRRLRLSRT